ncbi:MAG: hypothetical protein E7660_01735 [Ruminococcaceae bacterium]|nr:hypothetical protein [Oscillospiraceae bacterium]
MYTITACSAAQGRITFKIRNDETGDKLTLTVGKEFLPPFAGADSEGKELLEEEFSTLYEMSLVTEAASKALSVLSYGNVSRKGLIFKLTSKYKIEKEYAEAAADYAVRHRYIDEKSQAAHIADKCVKIKKQGKRKIAAYLISKGYEKEAVNEAINSVSDSDYEAAAVSALFKKTRTMPETREEKMKLAASLMRQGHTKAHIEKAFEALADENE